MWCGTQTQRDALPILKLAMQPTLVVVQSKRASVITVLTWLLKFSHQLKR